MPYAKPKRNLKLWGAVGLSLAIVGPTLAMAGNLQGKLGAVGKAVPLIFVFGAIGIILVAHGFMGLTQRYNQARRAYALVGTTIDLVPDPSPATASRRHISCSHFGNIAATAASANAFIANAQGNLSIDSGAVGNYGPRDFISPFSARESSNVVLTLL